MDNTIKKKEIKIVYFFKAFFMTVVIKKGMKKEEIDKAVKKLTGKAKVIKAKKYAGTVKSFKGINALKFQKESRNE